MTPLVPPPAAIRFTVNGSEVAASTAGGRRLLDVLRRDLGLTGTKEGCGEGECGACAVLVDGELVNSCLVPVGQVDGHEVVTVEGLAGDGPLSPLQQSFHEVGGAQCGLCTPGMLWPRTRCWCPGAPPAIGTSARRSPATSAAARATRRSSRRSRRWRATTRLPSSRRMAARMERRWSSRRIAGGGA